VNLLAESGIDELFLVPFDRHIALVEARSFCVDFVHGVLEARALVVGENFRFGAERGGDATLAREALAAFGCAVEAVPPVSDGGERISSTRVRAAVMRGDMATADRLLAQSFALRGRVVLGEGRGHDLGFPTANLDVAPEKTIPGDGVYSVVGRYDGRDYKGLVSIGTNPTFDGHKRTVEAWLLDFQGTLYGEELVLRDFRFIREQRKFEAVDELLAQMRDDATHVRFPSFLPS
jgi:riboflavin kinase/FMN adenylyltransferase